MYNIMTLVAYFDTMKLIHNGVRETFMNPSGPG